MDSGHTQTHPKDTSTAQNVRVNNQLAFQVQQRDVEMVSRLLLRQTTTETSPPTAQNTPIGYFKYSLPDAQERRGVAL